MKLRIEDNSLRLRLSEAEVTAFAATGQVAAAVQLAPGQALQYSLERAAVATVAVRYEPGCLAVLVPAAVADAWTGSAQVGFSEKIAVGENQPENQAVEQAAPGWLRVLVEKDLGCRH